MGGNWEIGKFKPYSMKNKILENIENQDGQVSLFLVNVVMFLLLFIGLFLANATIKQIKITRNIYKSVQAYYLADAGAERVLYEIKVNAMDPIASGPTLLNETIGDGSYKVEVINNLPLKIKSTGVYQEVARAVELTW